MQELRQAFLREPRNQERILREAVQRSLFPDLTDEEQPIVDYLKARGEGQINRMTVELNRPLSQLLSVLVELEFKGVVKALPGGVYKL